MKGGFICRFIECIGSEFADCHSGTTFMASERFRKALDWFTQAVHQPRDELDRWERAIRFAYDLGRHGARQLRQDRATQMAAALAYRTLFSLLPLLVVGTLLVRAIGGFDQFYNRARELFQGLGLNQYEVTPENGGAIPGSGQQTLSDWLLSLIESVEQINLAAITWVGIAVLIYSTIGLMVTIENSFNSIYRSPEGRSWARRIPIYWTVLSLGPAVLAGTIYLGNQFDGWLHEQGGWWSLLLAVSVLWNFVVTWLVIFAVYKLVPNTDVAYRPAMIGAFVAAVLLVIGKEGLGLYFSRALTFSHLYGSLGLIPVFMFWVYIMWLVVLFGLEVSAALQMLGGRRLEEVERHRRQIGLVDPASVLAVVELIAERFNAGKPCSRTWLSEQTGLAPATLTPIIDGLIAEGIVHRVETGDQSALSLARPPEQISARRLVDIGFELANLAESKGTSALIDLMREAQRHAASNMTLAGLIAAGGTSGRTDQASAT